MMLKKLFDVLAIALLVACVSVGAGCDSKKPAPAGGGGTPAVSTPDGGGADADDADDAGDAAPAGAPKEGTATIKGTIKIAGAVPPMPSLRGIDGKPECADQHATPPKAEVFVTGEGGTLGNVFVYISKGVSGKYPTPSEPVKFDQSKCIYVPHVLGVQSGQKVEITNSDPTLHNVHVLPKPGIRELNSGQPAGSQPITTTFRKAALGVSVKCDVHPWMQAYACVSDHPFFAVTGPDGAYSLPPKLPAGTYTVTAWHESKGTVEQEVTVADGETKTVDLSF